MHRRVFAIAILSYLFAQLPQVAPAASAPVASKSRLLANLEQGKPQTIVTYGTSLTAGGAWVKQLEEALQQRFPGLPTVINSGEGAKWSTWGLENLDERVIQKNPDTVFIEFSVNDAYLPFNTTVEKAQENLQEMIDRISKANANCEIILMVMNPPIGTHLDARPNIAAYNQMYRDVAKGRGLLLIDHYPQWEELLTKDRKTFDQYVSDGIHPGPEGCQKIILPTLLNKLENSSEIQILQTNTGVQFAVLGPTPPAPAPTLFIFAMGAKLALGDPKYRRCGNFLVNDGYLCVSVDLPCHGAEHRSDEPEGLDGWRKRIDGKEDPIADLNARLTKVLDYLIEQHWTDPEKVVACGTSRGGFAALQFAAAEPRVKAVTAYAPVTDLTVLREFQGLQDATLTNQLALVNCADKLANRGVWIAIGDRDGRVGTDQAIQFARKLSAAAAAQNIPSRVELHVAPSSGHNTPAGAEEQSTKWIKAQIPGG